MFCAGLSDSERNRIHQRLTASRSMIQASVFAQAQQHVVRQLEKPWIQYLKEDMKNFVE